MLFFMASFRREQEKSMSGVSGEMGGADKLMVVAQHSKGHWA